MIEAGNMWSWAHSHPWLFTFLAWSALWLGWGLPFVVNVIGNVMIYPFRLWRRAIRSRDIQAQGWPPHPLMDADGDIIHPPKEEKDE